MYIYSEEKYGNEPPVTLLRDEGEVVANLCFKTCPEVSFWPMSNLHIVDLKNQCFRLICFSRVHVEGKKKNKYKEKRELLISARTLHSSNNMLYTLHMNQGQSNKSWSGRPEWKFNRLSVDFREQESKGWENKCRILNEKSTYSIDAFICQASAERTTAVAVNNALKCTVGSSNVFFFLLSLKNLSHP